MDVLKYEMLLMILSCIERAVKTYRDIGPAVWNGGFSTLLAILPLSTSESHVFTTFFKVRYWQNE